MDSHLKIASLVGYTCMDERMSEYINTYFM